MQEEELGQRQEERMVQIVDLMKALLEGATLNSVPRQS